MKKIVSACIVVAVLVPLVTMGKVERRRLDILQSSVPETTEIARANMEFVYDYSYKVDTLDRLNENIEGDRMLLQISPEGISKFSSYTNLSVDSLILNMSAEQMQAAAIDGKLSNGDFMTIFRNYRPGLMTHTEKICLDWLTYDEEMPVQQWQLQDSTINVLGYECRMATCDFRGRRWTAWYCEDIPLMNGPWKLGGLPGLILKAHDTKCDYSFECIGINSHADRAITVYNVPYVKTTRSKFYDTKHRYDINPYAYAETTAGITITIFDDAGNPVVDAFDPIELSFDYIETDWK